MALYQVRPIWAHGGPPRGRRPDEQRPRQPADTLPGVPRSAPCTSGYRGGSGVESAR